MTIATTVACSRCRRTDNLIVGDGPIICSPCVELLTDAAADPVCVTQRLRDLLSELHADIVRLVDDDGTLAWEWTGWK